MGTPRKCPECGTKLLRIVYGMLNEQGFQDAEAGKFMMGGCDIEDNHPTHGCPDCGWRYRPPFADDDKEWS